MKINDKLYGFTVTKSYKVPELSATLFEMNYDKNGATLYFLDREDENKTFAISFKTIPEDDTGVFHIIEHSVLCGSKKYLVKEPFVELLKGSLQTFLNAMTYPDKTVYPVASRNDKDFQNLMNVYLDAVLHPAILENPNIFRQEGWHYELDGEGNLCRKGVVYNEMKGAYSSPDTLSAYNLMNMLYPDSCYRYESGGAPEAIPNLTYEQFIASHAKYYHPSNAQIFLDGSVNLDAALSLIDSYLSEYDALPIDFDIGEPASPGESFRKVEYEIAPTESEKNKGRVSLGYLSTRYDESAQNFAISVIFDAISSTNESVLKKKIIDSGLCEDFSIGNNDSMKRQFLQINFVNVKDGKEEELISLFNDTVREICDKGIDKELLEASLNTFEFKLRERDFGSMPKGIIFALSMLSSTLYGGNPTQELCYEGVLSQLREALSTDYYEKILSSLILENSDKATLIMKPSNTLGEKREGEYLKKLSEIKASFSESELQKIKEEAESVNLWQATPDSPEALATLPALTLDDIPSGIVKTPTRLEKIDTTPVLYHEINTEGIVYVNLYFDISDITKEEAYTLKLYTALTKAVPTEKYSASELQKEIKLNLGSLSFAIKNFSAKGRTKIYLHVSASALPSKKNELISLVSEVLLRSDYNQPEVLLTTLRQGKLALEEFFVDAGHAGGMARARAGISADGVVDEYTGGYEAYKITKSLIESFDASAEGVIGDILALKNKILNRSRLTVSVVSESEKDIARELVSIVPEGEKVAPVCEIKPFGAKAEGIVIPAQIAYASMVNNLSFASIKDDGAFAVCRTLLSYAHLWNAVRVQGGAYGSGFAYNGSSLNIGFYSYRDPTPKRSISCYKQSSEFLRAFVASGADLTQFIIGAVGDTTPLETPALKGRSADTRYLAGITHEDVVRRREELLSTNGDKLLKIADTLEALYESAPICVVAGKEKLDECDFLEDILTL